MAHTRTHVENHHAMYRSMRMKRTISSQTPSPIPNLLYTRNNTQRIRTISIRKPTPPQLTLAPWIAFRNPRIIFELRIPALINQSKKQAMLTRKILVTMALASRPYPHNRNSIAHLNSCMMSGMSMNPGSRGKQMKSMRHVAGRVRPMIQASE